MALCSVRGSNLGAGKGRRYTKWGQECSGSSASWQGPPSPTARERKPPRRLSARSTRTGGATAVPLQVPAAERSANDSAGTPRRLRAWRIACARGPVSRSSLALLPSPRSPSARPRRPRPRIPPGFSEQTVFSGLTNPTAVRFASDGRVFVAEKSGLIKVFDSLTDTTATVFADLNVNVYNFWDRGLLGLALAPNFPADPYVYVLYTYDHELGSTAPAPRWGTAGVYVGSMPDPARADRRRLHGERAPVAPSGVRQHDDRPRAGADRGLVPAISEPLDRRARLRARRGALRDRRRRRELQLRRLGTGRQPAEPVRRSAGRRRRHAQPADRRGRRPAQPRPTHVRRPDKPGRRAAARRPSDRRRPARQSARRQHRRERAADHRLRPAQPLPVRRTARHQRGVDRRRGLEHMGGDPTDPAADRRGGQLRLAVLRGRLAGRAATTGPT